MADGKVFNGAEWEDVVVKAGSPHEETPLHPILDGDGNIFVSIPSFRDGERCGTTLVELFAKEPEKVFVGLVEQAYEEDTFCIEAYCKEMGVDIYKKVPIRADTTKVIAKPERGTCPHIDQIRKLSIHNVAAKGPVWARSMTRKVLGNEEFCLQIDSHMKFVQDWDEKAKMEWAATGNEFGIISTTPKGFGDMDTTDVHEVPRQCLVHFLEVGIPHYTPRGDGKVKDLKTPLLSHAWSAGFSFSKCHLEESAPYDPFTPYIMGVEQFARYARFWTRGYDVYTPTQNIVYHNYQENPDGHNAMEWMKRRKERFRKQAVERIKSYLWLPGGTEGMNLSNLGIYGLGKRRTLKQLADFVGIDLETQESRSDSMSCANHEWVPYDLNISPVDNMFDEPDDLDPQPEYPLRTKMAFYREEEVKQPPSLEILGEGDVADIAKELIPNKDEQALPDSLPTTVESMYPSGTLIFVLWVFGLLAWCGLFLSVPSSTSGKSKA
eukprot:CAMPEP_0117014916 /NCGR_PEP_ID=MMETSP0472-20121206/12010_1 /TAXON_ID=693140 ORGANISM="Tiarina fusus, Strain LIS" /NCGR_SAMPLE_ID=MMETSP0472 /ASSEMBLY_ACC=CAM_ASM_000603 /LENGTH=492 /DNA_ID=CAMNT_0004718591 /DNA_START=24 /DNA_END=1499 /DNA_ORIENTATION=-